MTGMVEPALRFLYYAVLLGLFGWTGYGAIGLRGRNWAALGRHGPGPLVATVAVAAPLISAALQLTSIAAMMGMPVGSLDWPTIEAMLLGTGMGWAFLIRTGLLCAGFVALIGSRSTLAAFCYAGALMTLGWSGHAAATEGVLGQFHRLNW